MTAILHRLLGAVGRVLIATGLLVLAFAAFQYWGTGLAEARAQEELDGEFVARLQQITQQATAEPPSDPDPDEADDPDGPGSGEPDPEPEPQPDQAINTDTAPTLDPADVPPEGAAAGRILIPAIGVDKTYVQGVGRDDLRKGPGHYPQSPFPGQAGNAAIAGHRTTYGAPFFDLDQLVPGDEIIVETLQGRFSYLVNEHEDSSGRPLGHFIVDPTATWVLDDQGDNRLTLTACHPKRSAAQRIVVTATLNTTPAPPTPPPADIVEPEPELPTEIIDDEAEDANVPSVDQTVFNDAQSLDESLGWRPEHWPATAAWAAACALVALLGWLLGRRWRPRAAYALAAGPFLACLFVCFTHLDKLLPAI